MRAGQMRLEMYWFGLMTTIGWLLSIISLRDDIDLIPDSGLLQLWSHSAMLMSLVLSKDVIFWPLYNRLMDSMPQDGGLTIASSFALLILLLAGFAWMVSPYVFLFWLEKHREASPCDKR